jgi:hypothetical protein
MKEKLLTVQDYVNVAHVMLDVYCAMHGVYASIALLKNQGFNEEQLIALGFEKDVVQKTFKKMKGNK